MRIEPQTRDATTTPKVPVLLELRSTGLAEIEPHVSGAECRRNNRYTKGPSSIRTGAAASENFARYATITIIVPILIELRPMLSTGIDAYVVCLCSAQPATSRLSAGRSTTELRDP